MDNTARQTTRSTATMREHNVARRRMGLPFTHKPFGAPVGGALIGQKLEILGLVPVLLYTVPSLWVDAPWLDAPRVGGYWKGNFPLRLSPTQIATQIGRAHHPLRWAHGDQDGNWSYANDID